MKNCFKLIGLSCLLLAICSCGKDAKKIDYLPVTAEKGDNFGFVDAKGNLYLDGEFEDPSPVVEGVFSAYADGSRILYRFDKKKPVEIADGFDFIGEARDGKIVVRKKDSEEYGVINLKGKTIMDLDKVCHEHVIDCDAFTYGMLVVRLENNDSWYPRRGVINEKGKWVVKPGVDGIIIANDNLIFKYVEDRWTAVNAKGEKLPDWKLSDKSVSIINDYVVLSRDGRKEIYSMKGKLIQKCSDKVQAIYQIKDGVVVYEGEDGLGAISLKDGEKILSQKYSRLNVVNGKFLAKKDSGSEKYEILNLKGEKENTISDFEYIEYIDGFGILGSEGREIWILDSNYEPLNKEAIININEYR